MNVLFVMTARGGSKGIPRKNIKKLGSYPLLAYKIISAKKSKFDHRLIVSTDDEEIAEVAREYGAEVPFMRPENLSGDNVDSMSVVSHAVEWIVNNDNTVYDYICLLEPTSPFASYLDFNEAIDELVESGANSIASVKKAEVSSSFIHPLDENRRLSKMVDTYLSLESVRRQDQEEEYTLNGCIYCVKWDYFMMNKSVLSRDCVPYFMSSEASVDIDDSFDWLIAETIIEKDLVDVRLWDVN